jgi:hypothetical protein
MVHTHDGAFIASLRYIKVHLGTRAVFHVLPGIADLARPLEDQEGALVAVGVGVFPADLRVCCGAMREPA